MTTTQVATDGTMLHLQKEHERVQSELAKQITEIETARKEIQQRQGQIQAIDEQVGKMIRVVDQLRGRASALEWALNQGGAVSVENSGTSATLADSVTVGNGEIEPPTQLASKRRVRKSPAPATSSDSQDS